MLKEYPDIMDVNQVSSALGVSTKTCYGLLRAGKIKCLKIGRAYRIPKAHLLSYLEIGAAEENSVRTFVFEPESDYNEPTGSETRCPKQIRR